MFGYGSSGARNMASCGTPMGGSAALVRCRRGTLKCQVGCCVGTASVVLRNRGLPLGLDNPTRLVAFSARDVKLNLD
jgi:hypothetical protein